MNFFKMVCKILFLFSLSNCSNAFKDLASSDKDTELLIEAKANINSFSYTNAITILTTQVSLSSQAKTEFRETLASAYAGKCGLNFANFVNSLATSPPGGSAFNLVMKPFVGLDIDPASCLLSLNTMQLIGDTAVRNTNQNAFVSVVGMSLMGTQTRTSADINPLNGDGVVDQNLCTLADPIIDNIILGFGFMSKNFSALSTAQVGAGTQTSINDSISQCLAVAGTTCQITNAADITPAVRNTMRDLLNTVEYGLGTVVTGGNPIAIAAACP